MAAHPRPSRTRPQNNPTSNAPSNKGPSGNDPSGNDKFIELHPGGARAPRTGDDFQLNYLPAPIARTFKEALGCYSHGLNMAFAAMCRLTAAAVFDDLDESGKLKAFNQADEARQLGDIDDATFNIVRCVIFDDGPDDDPVPFKLDRTQAAVLLEVLKDMLYQSYIRGGKLRSALWMRRYFAEQAQADRQG
jgi:hypothetical protein